MRLTQFYCSSHWLFAILAVNFSEAYLNESRKHPVEPIREEETAPFMGRESWVRAISVPPSGCVCCPAQLLLRLQAFC